MHDQDYFKALVATAAAATILVASMIACAPTVDASPIQKAFAWSSARLDVR